MTRAAANNYTNEPQLPIELLPFSAPGLAELESKLELELELEGLARATGDEVVRATINVEVSEDSNFGHDTE